MESFRVQAKFIFLTYPQCDLPVDVVLQELTTILPDDSIKYSLVARELHEDGSPHIHACLELHSKITTKDTRYFDIGRTNDCAGWHPNIQTVSKSAREVKLTYCRKGGDFEDTFPPSKKTYKELLESANRTDFLNGVAANHARDYVVFHSAISSFADRRYAPSDEYTTPPDLQFRPLRLALQGWLNDEFMVITFPLLLTFGPTATAEVLASLESLR